MKVKNQILNSARVSKLSLPIKANLFEEDSQTVKCLPLLPINNTTNLKEKAKLNPRSTSGIKQKYNKELVSDIRSKTISKGYVGAPNQWSDSVKLKTVKKTQFSDQSFVLSMFKKIYGKDLKTVQEEQPVLAHVGKPVFMNLSGRVQASEGAVGENKQKQTGPTMETRKDRNMKTVSVSKNNSLLKSVLSGKDNQLEGNMSTIKTVLNKGHKHSDRLTHEGGITTRMGWNNSEFSIPRSVSFTKVNVQPLSNMKEVQENKQAKEYGFKPEINKRGVLLMQ